MLGTFLVRSGAITSVHAFAVDPARGAFILVLLVLAPLMGAALFGSAVANWLTIAYASADSIQILRVNDNTTFAAFTPPNARPGASSFLRQAVQTKYTYVRVPIPAGRLRTGANTISLDHEVHTNHATSGFMYDYLSLEAPTPPVLPPGRDISWKGGVSSNTWNTTATNWLVKGTTTPNLAFVDGDRPEFGE